MALSTVVKLLDSQGTALIETAARHWDADAVRRKLKRAEWIDVSESPGFSDYVTDLDAAAAVRLHEHFRAGYLRWIALYEDLAGRYRKKGELNLAEDHEKVGEDDKAQLAALAGIVWRASAEGLRVRILLEEWSSGY